MYPNTRTQGDHYSMTDDRLDAVLALVRRWRATVDVDDLVAVMLDADWPEGEEHQAWLDNAPPADIADWADTVLIGHPMQASDDDPSEA